MSGRLHKEPFAQVPEWLLYSGVSDRAVRVFAVLDRHADREGRAFPGRPKLAALVGCHVNSLDRAIAELRDAGALVTTARYRDDGSRSSSDYWLWPASPPAVGGTTTGGEGGATVDGDGASPPTVRQEREPDEREPDLTREPTTFVAGAVADLCDRLASSIEAHGRVGRPKVTATWSTDMRLLLERGELGVEGARGHPPEVVARAIDFTFSRLAERGADGFCWADQVRSPGALRRHWPELAKAKLRLEQGAGASKGARTIDRTAARLMGEQGGRPRLELLPGAQPNGG